MFERLHPKNLAKQLVAGGALALLMCGVAQAGEVQQRFDDQQARIAHGVRDGQLTRGEYFATESHLRGIEAQRNADLRADGGHLTRADVAQLNRELNRNSNRIYFDNHNLRRQP
jgi:hypothetical protein